MKGLANVQMVVYLPITDILMFLGRKSTVLDNKSCRVLVVDHEEMFAGLIMDESVGYAAF